MMGDDERTAPGDDADPVVELVIAASVVDLLAAVTTQVVEVHDGGADDTDVLGRGLASRLYPTAGHDPDVDAEVRTLVHDEVMGQRRDDLAALARLLATGTAVAPTQSVEDDEDGEEAAAAAAVRFRWTSPEASTLLRATHAVGLALALQQDPEVFTRGEGAGRPAGPADSVAGIVLEIVQELHEVVLRQLDPDSHTHAMQTWDQPD